MGIHSRGKEMIEEIKESDIDVWNIGKEYGVSIEYITDDSQLGYHAINKQEAKELKQSILQGQKLRKLIKRAKKYPRAMNYAQFEEWIQELLDETKNG